MILISQKEYNHLKSCKKEDLSISKNLPPTKAQTLYADSLQQERIKKKVNPNSLSFSKTSLPVSYLRNSIDKFPIARRSKANSILQQIEGSTLKWDEVGQIKNEQSLTIYGSHILDLIFYSTHSIHQRKT